ncbi:DUF2975 domain-containing protein [Erythrobacter sp. EC-HK427]|uniref:DUF2975 domain-containing protein n=1 Tax=Erythrobacter sp. EC-HK427 TaxID=2038396 RepID=UPI0012568835|nr:DUF2975 domain-containing protein [Erythrobacter sp. EC-HK427]VVT05570.1 conserved membrane hypothetical protein [Erythrobacter sp. EC-HK427]
MSTSQRFRDPLLLIGQVLVILMLVLLGIAAFTLLVSIPVMFFAEGEIVRALAEELGPDAADFPLGPILGVITLALLAVGMLFAFFDNLRRIIRTVGDGDPFAPVNADRLSRMAWLMLGVELIEFPMAAIGIMVADWAEQFDEASVSFEGGFDFSGALIVILLFILARVFKRGAEMRDDLEGTV